MPVDILGRGDFPGQLFKYRDFDEIGYSLGCLQKGSMWMSGFDRFNDPFDSTLSYILEDKPPGILLDWVTDLIRRKHPELSKVERLKLASNFANSIKSNPKVLEEFGIDQLKTIRQFGICSLSKHQAEPLMLSHYSKGHTGFCIGYHVSQLVSLIDRTFEESGDNITLEKISYQREYPHLNFAKSKLSGSSVKELLELLCTKDMRWEYEDEYRLFYHGKVNEEWENGHQLISGVWLGCKIKNESRKAIFEILESISLPIPVFQMHKHNRKFELVSEQVR